MPLLLFFVILRYVKKYRYLSAGHLPHWWVLSSIYLQIRFWFKLL